MGSENPKQCRATRRDGGPCKATPSASEYCFAHDPELREATAAARREGGSNTATLTRLRKRMPADLAAVVKLVEEAMTGVAGGTMKPAQGQALATLAATWVRLQEHGKARLELDEVRTLVELAERGTPRQA